MSEYTKLRIAGTDSNKYWNAFNWGRELEARFPAQDALDFANACMYAARPPMSGEVTTLVCLQFGENDGPGWIWQVQVDREWWVLEAWCDYTGWDCQSGGIWTQGKLPSSAKTQAHE